MNKTELTKDRVCTILREQLYSMEDNESQKEYEPLQLKWVLPIESANGMISAFKNIIYLSAARAERSSPFFPRARYISAAVMAMTALITRVAGT